MKIDVTLGAQDGIVSGLTFGTAVRTPFGGRRVEFLRRGDLVVTRDAGLQPLRLVWKRTVTAAQIAADPSLAPVRLAPRAIGPMMPQRDLLIAPGHRLLIPGFRVAGQPDDVWSLIPAREIAGSSDGVFVDHGPDEVTYYTLIFDFHVVIQANGMPVESFLPTPAALSTIEEERREDVTRLFPELRRSPSAYPPAIYATARGEDFCPDFA